MTHVLADRIRSDDDVVTEFEFAAGMREWLLTVRTAPVAKMFRLSVTIMTR